MSQVVKRWNRKDITPLENYAKRSAELLMEIRMRADLPDDLDDTAHELLSDYLGANYLPSKENKVNITFEKNGIGDYMHLTVTSGMGDQLESKIFYYSGRSYNSVVLDLKEKEVEFCRRHNCRPASPLLLKNKPDVLDVPSLTR